MLTATAQFAIWQHDAIYVLHDWYEQNNEKQNISFMLQSSTHHGSSVSVSNCSSLTLRGSAVLKTLSYSGRKRQAVNIFVLPLPVQVLRLPQTILTSCSHSTMVAKYCSVTNTDTMSSRNYDRTVAEGCHCAEHVLSA